MVKTIYWIQKRTEAVNTNDKDGKVLHKLTNNTIYGKTMKSVRKRNGVKLVNNKKDYLKCTSKPSYLPHKIFDNNLVAIRKSKLALKLNKPTYIGKCMLKFHYDYIKSKYDNRSKLLFTDTDSLMYKIKIEDVYAGSSSNKEMFDSSNYWTRSIYYNSSSKLVIGKMKDETGGVAIETFVGLKPKMYSFLVDNNEHKKAKSVNKIVVAMICPNEYKDILLNNLCIRHWMNSIQSKDHRIRTYEINKISLPCFDDKIYAKNNG